MDARTLFANPPQPLALIPQRTTQTLTPMSDIVLRVPMRRHLQKFVLWLEAQPPDAPVRWSEHSLLFTELLLLLQGKNAFMARTTIAPINRQKYAAEVAFLLPAKAVKHNLLFLNDEQVRRFDTFLGRLHNEMLLYRVQTLRRFGVLEKDAIAEWMRELKIDEDEDISFWGLKRALQIIRNARGGCNWKSMHHVVVR